MNNIPARGVWKDPRVLEIFEKMMAAGHTGAETANALNAAGFAVTRNAVLGHAKRLGLVVGGGCSPLQKQNGGRGRAKARDEQPERADDKSTRVRHAPMRALGAAFPVSPPKTRRKAGAAGRLLVEAENGECRWPISGVGAQLRVCGACCPITAPYCAEHMGVAYVAGTARGGQGNAQRQGARP
ncbi:GcrA family cell cycle regulator [Paracoccus sp. (in: a-proteobacteria)]|uniref:GcrA family cell cycle regulator n=1 Tax=Paracoccus sp. TaxID=267 RepID=UPI002AFEB4E5|nr:GcrA family cell cycle regulator [Paracoccus sp. (in: a-proteobacteria)]